jgi:Xaa-Pro aminopeptidase
MATDLIRSRGSAMIRQECECGHGLVVERERMKSACVSAVSATVVSRWLIIIVLGIGSGIDPVGQCARASDPVTPSSDPATPLAAVTRSPDGKPVCGLGRAFHEGRRQALFEAIGDSVFIIRGMEAPRDYLKFYQEKNFWYLTGVDSPGAALVMDGRTDQTTLFLPRHDAFKEQWDGEIWDLDDAWIPELTGFSNVMADDDFEDFLSEVLADKPKVQMVKGPWIGLAGGTDMALPHQRKMSNDPFDGRPSREARFEEELINRFEVECVDATRTLSKLRIIKQPEEIEAMKRAARVGAAAIAEGIRNTEPERGEWELEALMSFVHARHGAAGPAYSAICASGPNNNVLHYFHSNRTMHDGELLLVDYGPDVDHYTTDITRTWPVGGEFTEQQRKVYDSVLEAQAAGIAAAKPGNSMGNVAAAIQEVFAKHKVESMVRHAPTHYIGMEVHDVSVRGAFQPGMALAIEPGLYSEADGFGIRIEDVVVITAEGCEIITREGLPVEAEAIEAMVKETGLLER